MTYQIDLETQSQSKINSYRRCGYAYDLAYNQGIVPRVDRPAPALGTAVHVGNASALRGGSIKGAIDKWYEETMADVVKAFEPTADEVLMYIGARDLAVQISERAIRKFHEDGWQLVSHKGAPIIEYAFTAPLEIGFFKAFRGTLDLMAKDRNGMPWLIDWKVRGSFQPDEKEEYNLQMAAYQYLLLQEGVEAVGSIQWQIANGVPRPPEKLKSGKGYSRSLIRTTWEMYEATLISEGFDPNDYLDMRDKLSTVDWFRLSRAYRSQKEIEAVWNEIVLPTTREMVAAPTTVRNFHPINCQLCAYKDLCLEALRGGDVEFVKQVRFRRGTDIASKLELPDFTED